MKHLILRGPLFTIVSFFVLVTTLLLILVALKKPQETRLLASSPLTDTPAKTPSQTPIEETTKPVLVGFNYNHYQLTACNITDNTGIIMSYDQPGVREKVQKELSAMRQNGISSTRLLLWFMTTLSGQKWGIIPSLSGTISEPYKTNLKNYVTDVKNAGFQRLTIAYGPEYTNKPIWTNYDSEDSRYDPAKYDENLAFIKDTRGIAKLNGPSDTRFDIMPEGGPSNYLPALALQQLTDYDTKLYTDYVDSFGSSDVTISTIAVANDTSRLTNLIALLKNTGKPMPPWFGFSVYPDSDTADAMTQALQAMDAVLIANGLSQPITIEETYYNDLQMGAGIRAFMIASSRTVQEARMWPLTFDKNNCPQISVSSPPTADAFFSGLGIVKPTVQPTEKSSSSIHLAIYLHGIGKAGDNVSITDNGTTPLTPTRTVTLLPADPNHTDLKTLFGTIEYDNGLGGFAGDISTDNLTEGSYVFKIHVNNYLQKQLIITVSASGQIQTVPPIYLVTGDMNNDNKLDVLDYNMLIGCYSDEEPAKACDEVKMRQTDLNDDGKVNSGDYNLFIHELSIQPGD